MTLSLDLIQSLRSNRKNFGFVCLCVMIIGLGMALTMVLYSFVFSLVHKPLPFDNGDRFIGIRTFLQDTNQPRALAPTVDRYVFQAMKQGVKGLDTIGAYKELRATLSDGEVADEYLAAYMQPKVMQITDAKPLMGRLLQTADDLPGAAPVVVLSYRIWQNYYAGDKNIIGKISRINGVPHTIVGVMDDNFYYPLVHEMWLPLQLPDNIDADDRRTVQVIGVISEQAFFDQVNAELEKLIADIRTQWPEFYGNQALEAMFFTHSYAPNVVIFHALSALTFALLLLVCLNLANLLVVRNNERLQELAIRNALGASHWRLIKTMLLDSLIICLWGFILGAVLSQIAMTSVYNSMTGMAPTGHLPFWWSFGWNLQSGLAAFVIIIFIWLFAAGLAARKVVKQDLTNLLSGSSKGAVGNDSNLGSLFLVSFETVFSCFLLVLCGAFIGITWDLTRIDYGTETKGFFTGEVRLTQSNYDSQQSREQFRLDLRTELLSQSGISEVAYTSALPSQPGAFTQYSLDDRDSRDSNGSYPAVDLVAVSYNYFSSVSVNVLEGRSFTNSDTESSTLVAIIDERFAKQQWPNQSAIGKRIQIYPDQANTRWLTIVGVSSYILQQESSQETNTKTIYLPMTQSLGSSFSIVIKTQGQPISYQRILQNAVAKVDRDIAVTYIQSLQTVLERSTSFTGFLNRITTFIAIFTLVLALTGIYAVVARSVINRRHEMGIRRAVGSSNKKILWAFIRQGLIYLGLGVFIGGGGATLLSMTMEGVFSGILNWLPTVLLGVTVSLGILIFFAAYNPARKLTALEPGDALRHD